jgi:hypothetical protein
MLAFGIIGMFISIFNFKISKNYKYYLFFVLFLLFAFLSKTIGALIIIPILLLFLFHKNYNVLGSIKFWGLNALIIGAIGLFLYFRNQYADNYFSTHFLGYFSRFKTQYNADHDQPFDFYFNNIFTPRYSFYSFLLIPSGLLAWKESDKNLRSLVYFALLSSLFYILILSLASSKCFWYDVPLYPLFAIPVSYSIWKIINITSTNNVSISALVTLFFIMPVYYSIKRSHNNDISEANMRKAEVIPEYFHNHKNMPYTEISVVDNNYPSPILFYKYFFQKSNKTISIKDQASLIPNEIVIAGNDSIKNYITTHYQTEQLETYKNATIYKIKG